MVPGQRFPDAWFIGIQRDAGIESAIFRCLSAGCRCIGGEVSCVGVGGWLAGPSWGLDMDGLISEVLNCGHAGSDGYNIRVVRFGVIP